jgi:hypothetical protein
LTVAAARGLLPRIVFDALPRAARGRRREALQRIGSATLEVG